jgi:hypothetical protein
MSAGAGHLSDEERGQIVTAITNDSADVIQRQTDEKGFTYPIHTNVTTARG